MAELMQLHEVREYALETPKPEKHMIWVERHRKKTLEYLHIYCVSGGFGEREALEIDIEGTSETISLPFSTYKRSWRCWTDRPSDEQMSGAGWYYKTEYQKTEKRREYGEAQKEKHRETQREWQKRNAEYHREYQREWQKRNAEYHREYQREWARRNPDKVREYALRTARRKAIAEYIAEHAAKEEEQHD